MKFGKGIVKKYSREYTRTLKSGEKKKYKTEQIQITVSKTEDIYENKEEVLIIPNSEIEEFKNLEEENDFLKAANYFYAMELEKMNSKIEDSSKYENEIQALKGEIASLKDIEAKNIEQVKMEAETLNSKYSELIGENETLKTELDNIKTENEGLKSKYCDVKDENETLKSKCSSLKEEHSSIKESYDKVSVKYDQLKQENLNTKTRYAEIYEINEGLEKDYDTLRLEYNELVDKFNELEEELYKFKAMKSHDEYVVNKVKEFILKSGN